MFTLSKTLGRRSQLLSGANTGEPILSGIVHVTLNNKSLGHKFLEVVLSQQEQETKAALFIYKDRDKKRTESAIDLREAQILIEHDIENRIGTICRENRYYALELDSDKEDLSKFAAQWRSVFTVAQNPADTFTAITLDEGRGAVVLITTLQNQPITFKYMSGHRTGSQLQFSSLAKVQKFGALEVIMECSSGDSYHLISKRSDSLISKLELRISDDEDTTLALPLKSHSNDATLYASHQGYTPTHHADRAVQHVPEYIVRKSTSLPIAYPGEGSTTALPPVRITPSSQPLPPLVNTIPSLQPRSKVRNSEMKNSPANQFNEANYQLAGMVPGGLEHDPEEDYLTMDDRGIPVQGLSNHVGDGGLNLAGYVPMDSAHHDPLIADYLSMDSILQSEKITESVEEEDDDLYWDPSLIPPPRPPRTPVQSRRDLLPRTQSSREATKSYHPPAFPSGPTLPPRINVSSVTPQRNPRIIENSVDKVQSGPTDSEGNPHVPNPMYSADQMKPMLPPKFEGNRLRKPNKKKYAPKRNSSDTAANRVQRSVSDVTPRTAPVVPVRRAVG